jgi:3-oxoacyl-[acyl-carrier protein] reductase
MDLGLTGKVALVTGSSRGIGRGIALTLATEGCDVMLTGRDEAALRDVVAAVEKLGRKARFETIDLRKDEAPAALVGAVRRGFGRLDILVNNAGTTKRGDFLELTDADWQDGYALKFFAHVRLARAAWPLLQSNGGSIVTIGGTSGRVPTAGFTIGASVNAACAAFSKALADRGKSDGVQVNTIHPSYVETERLWRRIKADMERTGKDETAVREWHRSDIGVTRFGTPEDIAGLIAFMCSSRGRWLHGATIDMDGGEVKAV